MPAPRSFRNMSSIAAKAVTALVLVAGIYNNLHLIAFNPFAGDSRSWQPETRNRLLGGNNCTPAASESSTTPPMQSASSSPSSQSASAVPSFEWNNTRLQKKCFYVEDICHSSHRWFYRDSPGKRQPDVLLHYEYADLRTYAGDVDSAYESTYRFRKHNNDSYLASQRCVDSTVTNHVSFAPCYL
jgi:hypothetical protein